MPQKSKREPKRKPKYGMISCVAYLYNMLWKYEKSLVFTGILIVPVSLVTSVLALVIPSVILRYLETEHRFSTIALVIVGLVAADAFKSKGRNGGVLCCYAPAVPAAEKYAGKRFLFRL